MGDDDRRLLNDSILHATIVRQDQPSDDDSSIYHVFERLNTGGTALTPQEIRASIYHGSFNDMLRKVNDDSNWRQLFGRKSEKLRDEELILRFLALDANYQGYEKPMKSYLNSFMGSRRNDEPPELAVLATRFVQTVRLIAECIGESAFRPKKTLNAAVYDSVMVGVAHRLDEGTISDRASLNSAYEHLMDDEAFVEATSAKTSDQESVLKRIQLAEAAFRQAQ